MSPCAMNASFLPFLPESFTKRLQAFLTLQHLPRLVWPGTASDPHLLKLPKCPSLDGLPYLSSLLVLALYSVLLLEHVPGLRALSKLPTSRHFITRPLAHQGSGSHTQVNSACCTTGSVLLKVFWCILPHCRRECRGPLTVTTQ